MSFPRTQSAHDALTDTRQWLTTLRRYMGFVAAANLVWEFAHMPLYTLWETGSVGEIIFAAVHCTGGDILIALSAVMLSLFLFGSGAWPGERRVPVVAGTVVFGLAYTIFSEWLNIEIREAWAYRDLMPVIPILDAGLSPVLQWIIVPLAGFGLSGALPTILGRQVTVDA